jgi:hypothetical protein
MPRKKQILIFSMAGGIHEALVLGVGDLVGGVLT